MADAADKYLESSKSAFKGRLLMGFAIILQILRNQFLQPLESHEAFGTFSATYMILATLLLCFGCYQAAKDKGYHGAWAILGLFSLVGFIIMFFLPNLKQVREEAAQAAS